MQIEKLTENKIRIILSQDDLKENNIDLHSFMSNPIETQDLFFSMLSKAEQEIGFKIKDYRFVIESILAPARKFYFNCNAFFA